MTLPRRALAPRVRGLVYIAVLACMPEFGWAQADALRHDPFARPIFSRPTPPGAQPHDRAGTARLPEAAWKPELAAVMLAGPRSVVSIDGRVLRIGDEIDGHRLVEVHEQTAVFVRNGKKVTLSLRGTGPAPGAAPATKDERGKPERADTPSRQDGPSSGDNRGTAEGRDPRKPEEK